MTSEVYTPRLRASERAALSRLNRDDSAQTFSGLSQSLMVTFSISTACPAYATRGHTRLKKQPFAQVNALPRGGGAVASVHHRIVRQRPSQPCVAIFLRAVTLFLRAVTPAGERRAVPSRLEATRVTA
jgi:hypothetical protein